MNTRIIIILSIILIMVVFTFYFMSLNNSSFDIEKSLKKYDCAKAFDKFATDNQNEQYWLGQVYFWNNQIITDKKAFDFLDNRCYTTYKTWQENSNYDHFITKNSYYFDLYSWQEQMFNNEIICENNEIMCTVKEKSKIYLNTFDKYCKEITEMSSQIEKTKCLNDFMTELKTQEK